MPGFSFVPHNRRVSELIPERLPIQTRAAVVEQVRAADGAEPDPRAVAFSLSSDAPVDMGKYYEVLSHERGAIVEDRLKLGLPMLFNHDDDRHIGALPEYEIVGGKLYVRGRFGNSAEAKEKQADWHDGILKDSSVGYRVLQGKMLPPAAAGDKPTLMVTRWMPVEGSLVPVPADISVGRHRSAGQEEFPVEIENRDEFEKPVQEKRNMDPIVGEDKSKLELARTQEIYALAGDKDFRKFYSLEDAQRDIKENVAVDKVKDVITRKIVAANSVEKVGTAGDQVFGELDAKDQKRFSEGAFIRSLINARKPGSFSGVDAALERSVSDEIAKRVGRSGDFIPSNLSVRGTGYVGVSTTTSGVTGQPALVKTTTEGEVIQLLRNKPKVQLLGATVMGGLQGIIRLPRQTGTGTAYWLGEHAGVTQSDITTDYISVQPRRLSMQNGYTMELLALTSVDVEQMLSNDRDNVTKLALDLAAISGTGANGQPLGILNTTGLTLITPTGATLASGGKFLSYLDFIRFETVVAAANADEDTMGWMLTPETRGLAKGTPMFSSGNVLAAPIWGDSTRNTDGTQTGPLGYKAAVTNQLPKNLSASSVNNLHAAIFGNWANLILADWGAQELIVDPFTRAANAEVLVTRHSLNDVAVRHIESFAASLAVAVA